ncbi:MAG TPA: hypothetical protein VNM48_23255 [Chloroflexota bacterium]|nr:hypothetical protein [Chloroflexota bacterium]
MKSPKDKKAALSVLDEILGKCDDSAASKFKKAPKEEPKDEEVAEIAPDTKPAPKDEEKDGGETKPSEVDDMDLEELLAMYKKLK